LKIFINKKKLNDISLIITIFVFIILSIILILNHEFWRDEARSWHLASESNSLGELIQTTRIAEGTPSLWYIILYFLSHFITDNIESMKVLHLIISTATAFLIIRYAPFKYYIKIMMVFGYYLFYEYSIISRNYALGVFLIILFCVLYKKRYKNLPFLGIILFFAGQVNTPSFILSFALFIFVIIDITRNRTKTHKRSVFLTLFIFIFILSLVIFAWQLIPQTKSGTIFSISKTANEFINTFDLKSLVSETSEQIITAYMPLPVIDLEFWNTGLIADILLKDYSIPRVILASVMMIFPIFIMNKKIIYVYIFCSLFFITGFSIYKDPLRLLGYQFILLFISIWLSNLDDNEEYNIIKKAKLKKIQRIFLTFLLLFSLAGSTIAFYYDYKYPFSNGKYVAEYIENNYVVEDVLIIGYEDSKAETVAGYLDSEIYYVQSGKYQKLVKWDERKKLDAIDYREILSKVYVLIPDASEKDILIISSRYKISEAEQNGLDLALIKSFENAIVDSENYYLYLLES
jgi:hypothetical protein